MKKLFAIVCITIVASLVVISCKKSSTTTTTPATSSTTGSTTGVSVSSPPQVSYNLGGTSQSYVSNGSSIMDGSSSNKSINTSSPSTAIYNSNIYNASTGQVYLNINKGKMSFMGGSPDSTTFKAYFSTGSKSYSPNALNGIEVSMTDASGATWTTSTGSQTGSTFSIDAAQEIWSFGTQYMKVKVSFSCKLYDASGLNPKTITNGVFVGEFGNI